METRRLLIVSAFISLLGAALPAAGAAPLAVRAGATPPDKSVVIDGHVVHDAGRILNHVTNWGLIGSAPGAPAPFTDAPSAMWPGASGIEYLWAAGLWVGARDAAGTPHVTTGGFGSEFLPSAAAADSIYPAALGTAGGNRFPWSGADDDGDGVEDEDLPNGRDDDGDGLVDEDFAAFGDQQFVSTYSDTGAALVAAHPDHVPLGIRVTQRSIQWGGPLTRDFIGFDFTVTNIGTTPLLHVYLGIFSDCDIGPRGQAVSDDDYAGYLNALLRSSDGSWIPGNVAYMYDGSGAPAVDGYAGWILCDHTTDPTGATAPPTVGARGFQRLEGGLAFPIGGDPANDSERYQLLMSSGTDPNAPPGRTADYRVLMSSGPFTTLAPGASLTYRVALALGSGRDEMLAHAADAWITCHGVDYDRDGDPANGAEYRVPWLRAEDAPVAAAAGWLDAARRDDGADLDIEVNAVADAGFVVRRLAGDGVPARTWQRAELAPAGVAGHGIRYTLRDDEPVGWPREYALVSAPGDLELARTRVELPIPSLLALTARPNPFNPLVAVKLALPAAGRARLQVFDLQGRRLRTLLDGEQDAGEITVEWRGDDDQGRALPSGVYELRLEGANGRTATRVTLLR